MIKKIIIFLVLMFSVFSIGLADCIIPEGTDIDVSSAINNCLQGSSVLVQSPGDNLTVEGGFKDVIYNWVQNIGGILGLLAIGAITYGAFTLVISSGDDEKLKKGKDIIKWGILGFLGVVLASSIIAIIVNVIYSIGS
ncbi:MAG: hypothetical protein PHH06_04730 [Candidatus Gracilibacteria bacterium]|nr:hypothetical protein [Candidatus Gracilibacteria bacterium]